MREWIDKNDCQIMAGHRLRNDTNEPPILDVLSNEKGELFLGDFETPFDDRYAFNEFWEIVL